MYLGAVVIVMGALVFQGHLGGMMSFGTSTMSPSMPAVNQGLEEKHEHGGQYEWKDHIDLKGRK
jgi:hypothetical protein